ncbi:MAG: hypothetical protein U1D30_06770 [Planctomycetota bacterium]
MAKELAQHDRLLVRTEVTPGGRDPSTRPCDAAAHRLWAHASREMPVTDDRRFLFLSLLRMDATTKWRKARRYLRMAYALPDRPRHRRDDPFRPPGKVFDAILVVLFLLLGVASLV